jgi:transposase
LRLSKAARIEEAPVGFEGSDSAVALVGMDGFRLLVATEVDGELHQLVETAARVVACSACGTRALAKGRRQVRVRDLPAGGRRVVVVWRKRILRCPEPDCELGSWTEQSPEIGRRASMTRRARVETCRQVGQQNRSVACVARDLGVGWATVMGAVIEHGQPLVDDPGRTSGVTALGLDEVALLRANAQPTPLSSPTSWTWPGVGSSTSSQVAAPSRCTSGWRNETSSG